MTFDEAEEYRLKHLDVIGKLYDGDIDFLKILTLLIAPKNKGFDDRIAVLNKCLYDEYDNKTALSLLGFLNENLDVYIIGQGQQIVREKLLAVYLSETSNAS